MTALPTEMEDERVAAVASDAPSPMQEDAAADMMDVMDASHSERPLKRFQWDPSDLELEAAALAIALPDVEPAVRRPRERPERAARRRLDKAGRRREYKKRKDPLALVRDYLPRVRRRPRFEDAVRLDWQGDEDKKVLREAQLEIEAQTTQCRCVECKVVERLRDTHKYVCIDLRCTEKPTYDDLLELLEHQMTKHGRISLGCTRVVEALGRKMPYHFRRTTLPPPSVYVFSQYLNPAVRPVLWTDKACVHRERQRLYKGLKHIFSLLARRYVVNAFETAAMKVEGRGEVELASQYETALEFYNSALVHLPGDAHTVDDGSFAVGPGRNWLVRRQLRTAFPLSGVLTVSGNCNCSYQPTPRTRSSSTSSRITGATKQRTVMKARSYCSPPRKRVAT